MKYIGKKIIIYRITCLVNGKQYIGITTRTLARRWHAHVRDALTRDRSRALQRAIAAHGPENFEIEAIEDVDSIGLARNRERELIAQCSTLSPHGYNLTSGGDGAIGNIQSPETRAKRRATLLSMKIKRAPISEETRERQRQSQLGKKRTEETRQKMSKAQKGRAPSEATIRANRGRPVSAKCRERTAAANKARVWTHEARQKLADARRQSPPSAVSIEKTAAFNRGRKLPAEQKEKMSAALKAWWAANRLAPTPEVRQRQGRP
jgi:group I intron endonuclease